MKKHLSTILLVAVFLLGMCILLYPTVSDYWNSLHQTRVIGAYEDTLSKMTQKDYTAYFEAADAYNAALAGLAFPLAEYQSLSERPELSPYEELLDVNGAGLWAISTLTRSAWNACLPRNRPQRTEYRRGAFARAAACRWAARAPTACFPRTAACPAPGCLPTWTA